MAKKESTSISLNAKTNGFPVNHYFNRFCVEPAEDGILVHIGFQGSDSFLMGTFSFFIPQNDIDQQKESILQYIDALDFDGDEQSKTVFPLSDRPVHTVRFVHAGRTGQHAELLLYNIPVFQQVQIQKKPTDSIVADPLAALSSPLPVHVSLLKRIYVG